MEGRVLESLTATVLDVSEPHPGLHRVLMVVEHADRRTDARPIIIPDPLPEKVAYITSVPPRIGQRAILKRVRLPKEPASRHLLDAVEGDGTHRRLDMLGYCVSAGDAPF